MTAGELDALEKDAFRKWLSALQAEERARGKGSSSLNFFECNLETWRQLWRVCERSHVLLYLVDCRFPLFHFSEAIHRYVTQDLRKPFVLVLNKTDLSDDKTLREWEAFFRDRYGITAIARFSAFTGFVPSAAEDASAAPGQQKASAPMRRHRRRLGPGTKKGGGGRYGSPTGREEILRLIRKVAHERYGDDFEQLRAVDEEVDPSTETQATATATAASVASAAVANPLRGSEGGVDSADSDGGYLGDVSASDRADHSRPPSSIVIGTIGNPNVGKSALINGLALHKVVSVSRTPGHTKHFQTIRVASDIVLCDCPGMVFPAWDRPKHLQVICGLYPLPYLRDPYSALRYIAERYDLVTQYHLAPFREEYQSSDQPWSPMAIAGAYANKRGYKGRSGRPDTHRAAREILQDCIDGSIPINWAPPDPAEVARAKEEEAQETARVERALQQLRLHPKASASTTPPAVPSDAEAPGSQDEDKKGDGEEEEEEEDEEEEDEDEEIEDDEEASLKDAVLEGDEDEEEETAGAEGDAEDGDSTDH